MNRCLVLSLLAAVLSHPQGQPATTAPMASTVIDWNALKPVPTWNGQRRDVFDAPTATLDRLHGHITTLNPGENTGPLHRHPQEELVIVREGTIEVNIDGGSRRRRRRADGSAPASAVSTMRRAELS